MKAEQITSTDFPFISDQATDLAMCQGFLNGTVSRDDFEVFILQRNSTLKTEDEWLDELYRSWKMGRLAATEWAPECALAFREEINRILGEAFRWQ